jgi:hypothetical protein
MQVIVDGYIYTVSGKLEAGTANFEVQPGRCLGQETIKVMTTIQE